MTNVHDSGYKLLFSNHTIFRHALFFNWYKQLAIHGYVKPED